MNKDLNVSSASALVASAPVFPSKIVHLCGNEMHNPLVTSHKEPFCFQKYPHLKEKRAQERMKNASASFAHATAFVTPPLVSIILPGFSTLRRHII
jgi:hypothetical protein